MQGNYSPIGFYKHLVRPISGISNFQSYRQFLAGKKVEFPLFISDHLVSGIANMHRSAAQDFAGPFIDDFAGDRYVMRSLGKRNFLEDEKKNTNNKGSKDPQAVSSYHIIRLDLR